MKPNELLGDVFSRFPNLTRDIQRASRDLVCNRKVTIDFETFYGTGYSLRSQKINYTEYIRDPRFEIMCVSVVIDNTIKLSMTRAQFEAWLPPHEWWEESQVRSHNIDFDGLILAEKYGVRAGQWVCSLSMMRAVFQGAIGNDLDSASDMFGLPKKPDTLGKMINRRWVDLSAAEQLEFMTYCDHDAAVADTLADLLLPMLPPDEQELMHITAQQFLEPKLFVNEARLSAELNLVKAERNRLIERTCVFRGNHEATRKRLASTPQFAEILTSLGVSVPTKWSNKKEAEVEAFSKTDLEWLRLVDHWRQEGQHDLVALAEARMNCASSIHITRPARLFTLSNNGSPIGASYKYYGAHTGRWSGGNKLNFQNFKRKGEIRKCIMAPPGYVIVVGDASQIELRFNAWVHHEDSILDLLRTGKCVYRRMAGRIYGLTNEEADALDSDSPARFVGKVAVLGLGYSMSAGKFNDTLALGAMGPAVFLPQDVTNNIVYGIYRPSHPNIVAGWAFLHEMLYRMMDPNCNIEWGCLTFKHNRVVLPNGMEQRYEGLHVAPNGDIVYFAGGFWNKIYGGLFDENLIQALARLPVGDAQRRVRRHYPVVLHTHDELGILARERDADEALAFLLSEISAPPTWAADIPLKAEGGYDYCYSK